jgi:hypothetical protein
MPAGACHRAALRADPVAGMTIERRAPAFSRREFVRVLHHDHPQEQRAQGRPGDRCTRGPRARKIARRARDHRYRRKHSGLPCAVVYGLLRALPGETRLCCHRRRRDAKHHHQLGTCIRAPGPHDFAVRLRVARLQHIRVHRIPASRFVTIAIRPSCRGGMSGTIRKIGISEKQNIFALEG